MRARIQRPDETLHAPHLLDVEVASVLRRYQLSGELSAEDGREALADLAGLDIVRYPHDPCWHGSGSFAHTSRRMTPST